MSIGRLPGSRNNALWCLPVQLFIIIYETMINWFSICYLLEIAIKHITQLIFMKSAYYFLASLSQCVHDQQKGHSISQNYCFLCSSSTEGVQSTQHYCTKQQRIVLSTHSIRINNNPEHAEESTHQNEVLSILCCLFILIISNPQEKKYFFLLSTIIVNSTFFLIPLSLQ